MGSLDTYPALCGSVAGKASKLGVAMHDAGYRALGIDFKYVAVGTDDLASAVQGFKALRFRGFGVSMPFKADIISYLDEISKDVELIGACNTVVNDAGRLKGFNTDWQGAVTALEEVGAKKAEKAIIVGTGGVARAIAFGLKKVGWSVWIAGRTADKARTLCADLNLNGTVELSKQGELGAQLVVNATPVADSHGGPIVLSAHTKARFLLDVVFSPRETNLAAVARQHGLAVAPGWRMLLHQGVHQFSLYTGRSAPVDVMAKILEAAL